MCIGADAKAVNLPVSPGSLFTDNLKINDILVRILGPEKIPIDETWCNGPQRPLKRLFWPCFGVSISQKHKIHKI